MKRNIVVVMFLCLAVLVAVTFAASNPKATGDADFVNTPTGYNQQASTTFNAIATTPTGLDAKGSLFYSDPINAFTMDVQFLKVSSNTAWFVGRVTAQLAGSCCNVGDWIFWEVQDNGQPGIGVDKVWLENLKLSEDITDTVNAALKVARMAAPFAGPFTINGGNIRVH